MPALTSCGGAEAFWAALTPSFAAGVLVSDLLAGCQMFPSAHRDLLGCPGHTRSDTKEGSQLLNFTMKTG